LDTQGDEFEDETGSVVIPSSPRGGSAIPSSDNVMEMLAMASSKEKQSSQITPGMSNTKFS
jgi:hypothetical protein